MKDFVVIFDLDGTLINTDTLIRHSFEYVFERYKPGYKISDEEHLSFLGPSLISTFNRYFPESMNEELVECYREHNHSHHEQFVTIYPTVIDTLKTLKEKGYKLAILTTKHSEAAQIGIDLFDLNDYFDVIVAGDHLLKQKPDPEGIFKVMEKTNCHKAVMIGDNTSDILAGKNAGVYTIGVNWSPKGPEPVRTLNPDLMIDRMNEIIKFVEEVSIC